MSNFVQFWLNISAKTKGSSDTPGGASIYTWIKIVSNPALWYNAEVVVPGAKAELTKNAGCGIPYV